MTATTSRSRISKPSEAAASRTEDTTMAAISSPSRMMGQRMPLEIVPTFLAIKDTSCPRPETGRIESKNHTLVIPQSNRFFNNFFLEIEVSRKYCRISQEITGLRKTLRRINYRFVSERRLAPRACEGGWPSLARSGGVCANTPKMCVSINAHPQSRLTACQPPHKCRGHGGSATKRNLPQQGEHPGSQEPECRLYSLLSVRQAAPRPGPVCTAPADSPRSCPAPGQRPPGSAHRSPH